MKILVLAALGAALAQLPTCSSTPASISTTSVSALAQTICGFEPEAATVVNLIAANPLLNTAELAASAICNAIAPVGSAAQGIAALSPPVAHYVVNGKDVPIYGKFLKK